jgi:hypothetical protein
MRRHMRKIAIGAAAVTATVGAGGAIAATQLDPREESQALVNDAAEELGVEPSELTAALKEALANRVDEAVEAGRLTEAQGEELKERIRAGDAPLLGFGGPGFGPRHHIHLNLGVAAEYLGMTDESVSEALHDGKTLAELARARNKSVDGLVNAMAGEDASAEVKARVRAFVNGEMPRRPFDRREEAPLGHF